MNLIGYGLAKFDMDFVKEFGFKTRSAFYQYCVDLGLAKTIKSVTNRQDSFDPYFDNGRKGWYQRKVKVQATARNGKRSGILLYDKL